MTVREERVMIVGAGGHSRVIESLLALQPTVTVVGVADQLSDHLGERVGHSQIITTLSSRGTWRTLGVSAVALAIGDNDTRASLFDMFTEEGWTIMSIVHPTAVIERSVTLGRGVVVCAGAIICAEASIGDNVLVNTGAIVDHESRIGRHAHIGPRVSLAGRVVIGERTFVGAGSTVRDGTLIGARTIIGCGSVVVDDIPDASVAFGVPARIRRSHD